ncbi:MAG: DUF3422 domain-containing protein [Hyphomicrobiales bacterium]|uniref:DUF3422 family protein n=1 Tax=Rhabdaerophilum calidifontis TaxID=2604328 RepID=UPI00123B1691|nr:DUF3422 domain-containing protein [Rhabdaerophilum calidifontis]MCA1952245.1 DUF3422 domain-containing protein [Hyphomicrobiales bacterium]MCA1998946.1 DUF3422 domain-containing protein [Hyphomicrobiales bacterium]
MASVASTPPFEPHPARHAVLTEAHSRPFFPFAAPARLIGLAFLRGAEPAEKLRERLDAFARSHGRSPAPEGARHHRHDLPQGLFRWEEHTEFMTFVFLLAGEHARFEAPAADLMRSLPLPEQPGPHLASIDIALVEAAEREKAMQRLRQSILSHSRIETGMAEVASDFAPDEGGFVRVVVVNHGMTERRLGALARDITEIEFYRTMALLGLPEAQRIGPVIRDVEQGLAKLTAELVHRQSLSDGDALLARLTMMTARVESEIARTTFRFGATRAYAAILAERLATMAEPAGDSAPAIASFLERRNAPAFRTCERMEDNLAGLAARLTRASGLLRTRIDVELAKQNNALLAAMAERTRLQLRLQETVEGLSVAAISYYVVGLAGYLLKGAKEAKVLPLPLDLAMGLSVPVIVALMWVVMRRLRRGPDDSRH